MARGFGLGTVKNTDGNGQGIGAGSTDHITPTAFTLRNNVVSVEWWMLPMGGSQGEVCTFVNAAGTEILALNVVSGGIGPTGANNMIEVRWTNAGGANSVEFWAFGTDFSGLYWNTGAGAGLGNGSIAPPWIHCAVSITLDSNRRPHVFVAGNEVMLQQINANTNGAQLADCLVSVAHSAIGNHWNGAAFATPFQGWIERVRVYNDAFDADMASNHAAGIDLDCMVGNMLFGVDMTGAQNTLWDEVTGAPLTIVGTRIWDIEAPDIWLQDTYSAMPTPHPTRYTSARRVFSLV